MTASVLTEATYGAAAIAHLVDSFGPLTEAQKAIAAMRLGEKVRGIIAAKCLAMRRAGGSENDICRAENIANEICSVVIADALGTAVAPPSRQ